MKINKLITIFIICFMIAPVELMASKVGTLKVGKDYFYFNGVKTTSVHGLETALKEYKNTRIIVFLCTNGDAKKLIEVMTFLENNGISEVTLKSSQEITNC